MNQWTFRIVSALCALSLAGCGVLPTGMNSASIKPSPAQIAKYNDLPAVDVVATLEKNVNEAKAADMPFLSPRYFRDASHTLSKCQSYLGNKPREELASCAAQGDAVLEKGRAIMAIVNYRFAQELALKKQLDALNTEKLLPKEYAKVIGDLSGLIDIVEREQSNNIDKEKEVLLKALQSLQVQSVQEGALRESETINADSKKKNADKQAPLTFAEALRVYQDAKTRIATGYQDPQLVQRLGADALFAARHAQQVNERVALLQTQFSVRAGGSGTSLSGATGGFSISKVLAQDADKSAPAEKASLEKIVLQEESRLNDIAIALRLKDLRDLSLEKQVEEIKRAAGELVHQPKGDSSSVSAQDVEARLHAANEATRQALAQVEEKDRQLAEKDAQISDLTEKITQLENAAKPAVKAKAAKPKK